MVFITLFYNTDITVLTLVNHGPIYTDIFFL